MKSFVENGLDIQRLPLLESLMSLGNGYMGVRGYLEEFDYPGSIRGNYINGIYERIPMQHAEWAWGFPLESDRMPNLIDLFNITIILDDEKVVITGDIEDFKREVNFEDGLSHRSYKYKTSSGKLAEINFEQLLSFTHIQIRTWTLNIVYDGHIKVINNINFDISNMINEKDPRTASKHFPLVEVVNSLYSSNIGNIWLETIKSGIKIMLTFKDEGKFDSSWDLDEKDLNIYFSSQGSLEINRTIKCSDSIRNLNTEFVSKEELYRDQKSYLKSYHDKSSIDFLDNSDVDDAMDFMEFHILQSTSQDPYGNISAKGLSGEGYEGHYFWDTEIFLFPVWLLWDKERANNLLLYRYGLLNFARARALEMGHLKGACFPWRTISGIESSGYFPAGSAQYHINFDIAYTFIQYWLAHKDMDFLVDYSMELLIETARTALEIGSFEPDGFHIHTVTGPDEYTALVSDNYYTNKMAEYNLNWAVKLWNKLEKERYDDWLEIRDKLHIEDIEIEKMREAAAKMYFIYDEEKGIIAQDSTFLTKAKWPIENNLRPLLLNYHPLTIYRHQILKQSDAVLAQYLMKDISKDIMSRTFYYYEDINTHDSSLSKSVSGLMATRLRDEKLSYDLFIDSLYMDLKDLNQNTTDGLHMANIGGSLISVLQGFGGIRFEEDGLHINPYLPKKLGRLKFRFTFRDTVIEVFIDGEDIRLDKVSGPSTSVILRGERIIIGKKAVLFDLDGVLTGTSDNHYEAWKKMSKELGYNLPESFRDKLRGISRMDSIDLILKYFNLNYSTEEKLKLSDKKNEYYKRSIASFTPDNLYPGVVPLLKKLKEMNVKIGLVSASKNARQLIENMKIEKYFDAIVDPKSIKKGKPFPDPFLAAAEMLDIDPRDCLGVEDAKAGIDSINAAGMTSVGIGDDDLSRADFLYSTIEDASNFIINSLEDNYGGN